jgi:uncharacterized membrane protein
MKLFAKGRTMRAMMILLVVGVMVGVGLVCMFAGKGDKLTPDQRRAVEAAMETMPHADRAIVEKRAESWGHAEMEKIHRMHLLKQNAPHLWHEANAKVEKIAEALQGGD